MWDGFWGGGGDLTWGVGGRGRRAGGFSDELLCSRMSTSCPHSSSTGCDNTGSSHVCVGSIETDHRQLVSIVRLHLSPRDPDKILASLNMSWVVSIYTKTWWVQNVSTSVLCYPNQSLVHDSFCCRIFLGWWQQDGIKRHLSLWHLALPWLRQYYWHKLCRLA